MSANQQSKEQPENPSKDSTGLEVELKGADALVKHGEDDSKITKMLGSLSKTIGEKMDESEKELHERSRGLIHKDARLWFVPAILILIVLVGVVLWGITVRSSKNEDLFDKIISSQDKFETIKTLRNAEQHEIYYGFSVIVFGLFFVGLGAAALLASRIYTASDARNVGTIGRKAALLSTVQMVQIRQDQVDKKELKDEVKSKESKLVIAEEKTRETQEKLNVTEKELELNKQQLEETKRDQMRHEKMYKEHVDQLSSDKESLKCDLRRKEDSQIRLQNELRSQRDWHGMEQENLRRRIAAEREKQDRIRDNAYYQGRDSKSDCVCM